MPNFCAAPNCTRKSTQSDLAFFRFPRDPGRCQKWVENCRRSDLEDKTPDQLNKHYRLCAQHFEDSMICRSSPYRTVLRENAIPTIFDLTSHLGNPGRQRKRIKELSEEEIRTLKERKRTEMVFGLNHSFNTASKSFVDIELLIAIVRLHPELYDPQNAAYVDPHERIKLWHQISSEIFVDWDDLNPLQRSMKVKEVQSQWQSLWENFRRELHCQMVRESGLQCTETSGFSHFKDLLFLKPLMMPWAATRSDPPTSSEVPDDEDLMTEDDLEIIYIKDEPSPNVSPFHADMTPDTADLVQTDDEHQIAQDKRSQNLAIESAHQSQEFEDSHMTFAKSLVPYLAQVPYSQQASLRMALTNVIFCYIENSCGQAPTSSPELLRHISSSSFQQPPSAPYDAYSRRRRNPEDDAGRTTQRWIEGQVDAVVPEQENHQTNNNDTDLQLLEIDQTDNMALTTEEKEYKDYIKSLFETVLLMGKQNVSLEGRNCKTPEGIYSPDNFQALLEYRINSGDDVLRRRFEMLAVNQEYCSRLQQEQILEVCESCIREEVLREVWNSQFFSILCEDAVDLAGEEHIPVFIRHIDNTYNLREEFIGFLPCVADAEELAINFLLTLTEKWGLNMEFCRGLSCNASRKFSAKMKVVTSRLLQKYPQVTYTLSSSCALNLWLSKSTPVSGVSVVLGILKDICLFFKSSPQLQEELEGTIASLFRDNVEKGSELVEVLKSDWASRHDAFEIIVTLLHSLIVCLDKVACDDGCRWDAKISSHAFILSSALTDFDFVATVVILKNALSFTRAFGKNLQSSTSDVFSAANSLTAVLHALNEVMDNIEVYHEFWFEEATNLAGKLHIQVKLPGQFRDCNTATLHHDLTSENFYKDSLSIPTIQHIIQGLKDIFSEQHIKALKCLSLVPFVMGQLKFGTSEEHNADKYKSDLPNPDTLSAELHCWRVKWKHRGKDVELPTTIFDSLQLPDIKFFPNVQALLKVLSVLPIITMESKCETSRKRLSFYVEKTPKEQRSSHMAFLNVNYDTKNDLDLMVDTYMKAVQSKDKLDSIPQDTDITEEV